MTKTFDETVRVPGRPNIRSLLTALTLATLVQVAAQAAADPLKATLGNDVVANNDSLTNALITTIWSAKIRGGIAVVGTCTSSDDPKISVHLAAGLSVRHALESIRSAAPEPFTWQAGEGVVDIAIGAPRPPILDYRIDKYEWTSDEYVLRAAGGLFQTPGIMRRLKDLGLMPGLENWSILQAAPKVINPPPLPPPTRSRLEGVRVLTALNRIIRSYPNGSYWKYDERRCGTGGTYVVWAR